MRALDAAPGSVPDRIRERVALTYRLLSPSVLRGMNRFMFLLWRLGLGWVLNCCPALFGRYMVITTTGRRTGRLRRNSVNYVEAQGCIFCVAAWGDDSSWYLNLLAQPTVELWTAAGSWQARAERVDDEDEAVRAVRMLLADTGILAPLLAGVKADAIDEQTLAALARWWPVIRFRKIERLREGGPGDLWPLAAAIAGLFLFRRRVRRYSR